MAQLNFDATQVAPDEGTGEALPAGWYNAMIDESEMKPTKAADGSCYLQLRFTVLDGQYAGRKFWDRLNLVNANDEAVRIAKGQLSALCHATGVMQVQDTSQLHGIPVKVRLKYRAANDQYEASNDVGGYKNINEQVQTAGAAPATGAPQMPPTPPQTSGMQMPQMPNQQTPQQPAQQPAPQAQQPAPQQWAAQQWQQPQQGAAQQPWQQGQQQAPQQPQHQQESAQQVPQQQAPQQTAPQTEQPQQQAPAQGNENAQPWATAAAQQPGGVAPPWQQGGQPQ